MESASESDHQLQLVEQLQHYKEGYEQANNLCTQLMEVTESLQSQLDAMEEQVKIARQEESEKWAGERVSLKALFAKELESLKQLAKEEQQRTKDEHQKIIQQKDAEIERITGQLARLFELHSNPSAGSETGSEENRQNNSQTIQQLPAAAPPIEEHEEFIKLQNQVKQLQEQYEAERKRADGLESKHRLLERIKNALKESTDQTIAQHKQKIAALELELENAKENKSEEVVSSKLSDGAQESSWNDSERTKLEATIAQLTREVTESKDKNISLSQENMELNNKLKNWKENSIQSDNHSQENSRIQEQNQKLQAENSSLLLKIEELEKEVHSLNIKIRGKDSECVELERTIKELTDEVAKQRNILQNYEVNTRKLGDVVVDESARSTDSEEENRISGLQSSLQTYQNTITELQQQCNALQQEIIERQETYNRQVNYLQEENQQLEQSFNKTLQSHKKKLLSYENTYKEIEEQLEQIFGEMNRIRESAEKFTYLQDELDSVNSNLQLTEKDLAVHKEILHQERKNLEASKEIICDLQNHIIALSQNQETLQSELDRVNSDYEELQLNAVRQKKAFEQEKNAIVFDLLQKQMKFDEKEDDDFDISSNDEASFSSPSNGGSHPVTPSKRDEKRSLSLVKQKLIDELWKETWDMINSPDSTRLS